MDKEITRDLWPSTNFNAPYKNEAWLRQEYWQEQKSIGDIARELVKLNPKLEVWSLEGVIMSWMIKHGVRRRTRSQATTLAHRRAGNKSGADRKREKIIKKLEKISQQLWDLAEEMRE